MTQGRTSTSVSASDAEGGAPLRVGVVGFGWAGQQHMAAYHRIPGVELVAIAGQETEVGAELAEKFDVPTVVADWQDLVAIEGLDAVSVAVPTFLHAPIAIAALEAGLHVLSEKPIARTAVEGQAMVDAARAAGRVLDVAFNHRRRGDVQTLRRIIERGDLGRLYHGRASWMRRRGIPRVGSWFTNKEQSGGGPLADLGVHVIDWALYLMGEPRVVSVSAASYSELGPRGLGGANPARPDETSEYEVEDLATAFIRLEGGATLSIETSWAVHRDPEDLMDFSVHGTDGGADLTIRGATATPVGDLTIFRDVDGVEADEKPEAEPGRGHDQVVDDFVEVLRDPSRWAEHDGTPALTRAKIIDAAYLSAAEGREVQL
jgi:predicted dehydrogenase